MVFFDKGRLVLLVLQILDAETRSEEHGEYGVEFPVNQPVMQAIEKPVQVVGGQGFDLGQGYEPVATPAPDIGKQNTQYGHAADGVYDLDAARWRRPFLSCRH
jgi:hypothetical protein